MTANKEVVFYDPRKLDPPAEHPAAYSIPGTRVRIILQPGKNEIPASEASRLQEAANTQDHIRDGVLAFLGEKGPTEKEKTDEKVKQARRRTSRKRAKVMEDLLEGVSG